MLRDSADYSMVIFAVCLVPHERLSFYSLLRRHLPLMLRVHVHFAFQIWGA